MNILTNYRRSLKTKKIVELCLLGLILTIVMFGPISFADDEDAGMKLLPVQTKSVDDE